VKQVILAVLLVACLVSVAVAADRATSVARPDVVAAGQVAVHAFVNKAEIEATGTKIFISDYNNGTVGIFSASGTQLAQITGLLNPQGLAIDSKNNLYIANTGDSDVLIYAPPYTKVTQTLSDAGQYPVGISVLNDGQFIAVSNIFTTNLGPGSITFYNNGIATNITGSTISKAYFCGFDAKGNLYFDGFDTAGNVLLAVIPKLTTGGTTVRTLTSNQAILFPGDVVVTARGKIAIGDQTGLAVYTFNPPVSGSLGTPILTTPLTGSGDPVTFAFTSTDSSLWTADAVNLNSADYKYPAGGSPVRTFSIPGASVPIGAAVSPGQIP
jgi:hypothetical protein